LGEELTNEKQSLQGSSPLALERKKSGAEGRREEVEEVEKTLD
jgi:hypothetical protein